MASSEHLQAADLRPWLEECGYSRDNLISDFEISSSRKIAIAGFSQLPFDSRSACLIAMDAESPREDASAIRFVGAPINFLCLNNELHWWRQGDREPSEYLRIPSSQLEGFFREHRDDLSPQTIYRAKTLGRFETAYQRDFVDLGLMPLVEQESGQVIERLLIGQVSSLRGLMGWNDLSAQQGQWLVKSVFWLLGAKMLHDKRVSGFIRLDFGNVEQVLERVAKHYGQSAEAILTSQKKQNALQEIASNIASSIDLRVASTESLAYVYENTLITKEVRKGLGTHSTPAYLIDYIVGRLAPLIQEMPTAERSVFEPACGHGGFLVSAVRLLTSLLEGEDANPENRKSYLRQRIQGCDVDDFALEIARLSLTLTDIPNPNGWNLRKVDAFASGFLEEAAQSSNILLANPPFEKFEPEQKEFYAKKYKSPDFVGKTPEMLHRCVKSLKDGGVFGLVIPQNLLHNKDGRVFREMLCKETQFEEICNFPDRVFNFADVEVSILIGKKLAQQKKSVPVRFRKVGERGLDEFRNSYVVARQERVSMSRFSNDSNYDFRVPDLDEIWSALSGNPKLEEIVDIGQGFSFIGKDRENYPVGQERTSETPRPGFKEGFENLGKGVMTHQLPPTTFLNLSPEIVRVALAGTTTGIPQLLTNEARIQRAPWCSKAMIDEIGHPVSSRFTTFRLKADLGISLPFLWALINSPIANSHAYSHLTGRDLLTGTWRAFPIPQNLETLHVEGAVKAYLQAIAEFDELFRLESEDDHKSNLDHLKTLHWRIDAEVLKLYELPVELERQLLDYFAGVKRAGVPFHQDRYFPEGFDLPISLADYLAITADWEETNERRLHLIEKKLNETVSEEEIDELNNLKRLARAKSALEMPLQEGRDTNHRREGL